MAQARWVEGRNGCNERTIAVAHARKGIECRSCRICCVFLCSACHFGRVMHAVEGAGALSGTGWRGGERGMDLCLEYSVYLPSTGLHPV